MKFLTALLLVASFPVTADAQEVPSDHPVHLDRTGITWVLPFEAAQERARALDLPLLTKAVAFGTTKQGCW